jgi:hypothetical protein
MTVQQAIVKPEPASQSNPVSTAVNRRRYRRYRLSAPIFVHTSDGLTIPAMTLEISEHGLSAVLASSLKVGGTAQLEPVAENRLAAQVRYIIGKVHGFEFQQVTEEQTNKLRKKCSRLPLYPPNKMGI